MERENLQDIEREPQMRRMNSLNRRIEVTSILVLVSAMAVAQSPLSFFPHHAGDVWEYTGGNPPVITQERITTDSLGADGRYYLYHTYYGRMIVDTAGRRVLLPPNLVRDTAVYYRLDAHFGDSWVVARFASGGAVVATVRSEFQTILFGQTVQVKKIEYADSGSGLLAYPTDYLGSGFGIIGQDIDTFPDRRLSGAIIDGVQYGTITLMVSEEVSPVRPFVLQQNFPNPFNPMTTIQYELNRQGFMELKVYDLIGNEMATLFSGHQTAGIHRATFEGSRLPSGTYVYRLKTEQGSMSRRMLLIK